MSTKFNRPRSSTEASADSASLPTFTLKKKSKKSSKRKKSKPINKIYEDNDDLKTSPSPLIMPVNDENDILLTPQLRLSLQAVSKSAKSGLSMKSRSKSPHSSPTKRKKQIQKASDILKSSPRSARKANTKQAKHSKHKSVSNTLSSTKSKTPRRRNKQSNSSRNSMQLFFPSNGEKVTFCNLYIIFFPNLLVICTYFDF